MTSKITLDEIRYRLGIRYGVVRRIEGGWLLQTYVSPPPKEGRNQLRTSSFLSRRRAEIAAIRYCNDVTP